MNPMDLMYSPDLPDFLEKDELPEPQMTEEEGDEAFRQKWSKKLSGKAAPASKKPASPKATIGGLGTPIEVTASVWKKYGKERVYFNMRDRKSIACYDLLGEKWESGDTRFRGQLEVAFPQFFTVEDPVVDPVEEPVVEEPVVEEPVVEEPVVEGVVETTLAQAAEGQTIHATIIKASSNAPQAIVISQDGSLDEIRFGLPPILRIDRESQRPPYGFRWCDYKKWDSSMSKFQWECRGEEIPSGAASTIWRSLDFGWG